MNNQHRPGSGRSRHFLFPIETGIKGRHFLAALLISLTTPVPLGVHAQAVGYSSGQFAVDPTGAATYRVPILVPPGVHGLQPDLALLYNSRAGNGQLGVGWSLSGLSAITRCPRTRAQDGALGGVNFDSDDRFCLDGQHLMLVGGTRYGAAGSRYRTEIESFQDVQAEGMAGSGPLDFVVRDKSGLRREYGTSGDSRPLAHNSAVRLWLLRKISDRFGNYIRYTYNFPSGEPLPAEISYGNSRNIEVAKVVFNYQGRADQVSRYVAGEEFVSNQRLTQISTYIGGNKVKSYSIGYAQGRASGRSQLTSITECDPVGNCLQPLNFGWQQSSAGFSAIAKLSLLPGNMSYLQIADFDSDSVPDYLYVSSGAWYVRLGKNPGIAIKTGLSIQNGDQPEHAMVADMNGDGCADLVTATAGRGWYVWYSNCDGTLRTSQQGYRPSYNAQDKHPLLVDLNGDGYPELVFKYTWSYSGSTVLAFYSNGPAGLSPNFSPTTLAASYGQKLIPINFFGNGTADIYVTRADDCSDGRSSGGGGIGGSGGGGGGGGLPKKVFASTVSGSGNTASCAQTEGVLTWSGSGLTHANLSTADIAYTKEPLFLDLNGDGLTDLLSPDCTVQCKWQAFVNRGGAWPQAAAIPVPSGWVSEESMRYARAVDYNGDGLSDFMYANSAGRWNVLLFNGTAFGQPQDTGLPTSGYQNTLYLDYDGNGLADMVFLDGSWKVRYQGTGIVPDLIQQVVQGTGSRSLTQHTIAYLPLSDLTWRSVLYSGPSGAVSAPVTRHFMGPLYVVRSFASHTGYNPNGVPIYVTNYYRYAGAKLDQQGRGFLGFAVVEAANTNTNIVSRTSYRQDFPFTGMVSQTLQYVTVLSPTGETSTELQGRRICRLPNGEPDICPAPPPQAPNSILDQPPGQLVTQSNNSFAADITPVGTSGGPRFPYVRSSTVNDYDLNSGVLYRKTVTGYNYDTRGNRVNVSMRTYNAAGADVYDVLTSYAYADDNIANWCLGLLSDTQVTRVFNGVSLTLHSRASHNPGTCARDTETIEPGSPALELLTAYGFDEFGNHIYTTVSGANITARTLRTEYDAKGLFPVRQINPLGQAETAAWDPAFGNRLSRSDANGVTTRWQYDSFGRKSGETAPHTALQTTWSYAWCSPCRRHDAAYKLTVSGTDGSRTTTEYDVLARAVSSSRLGPVINGAAQVIDEDTYYDPFGRAYLVSRPYFDGSTVRCWNYRQYDNLNRLQKEMQPASSAECVAGVPTLVAPPAYGRVTQYSYNGMQITITDPLGRSTVRLDNHLGKPASIMDADGHTTYYSYDPLGNAVTVTDAKANLIRMAYDLAGHKTEMWDPDMGHWAYQYDALGQLLSQTNAKGQVLTQNYDVLGRLVRRTEAEGGTIWKYDAADGAGIGKLAAVTRDDGYREVYAYDKYGAPTDKVTVVNGREYPMTTNYDDFGRVKYVLYPDINMPDGNQSATEIPPMVEYSYDATGHLSQVHEIRPDGSSGIRYWALAAADVASHVTGEVLGNGVARASVYDDATGLMLGLNSGTGSATLQSETYRWDGVGNLRVRNDEVTGLSESFDYDRLDRLVNVRTTAPSVAYSVTAAYDAIGNIQKRDGVGHYAYGGSPYAHAQPHAVRTLALADGSQRNYSYDANGNLTKGAGRSITWTSYDKPKTINGTSFRYAPDRSLILRSGLNGTGGIYIERLFEAATLPGGSTEYRMYVYAADQLVAISTRTGSGAASVRYPLQDHLGSTVLLTDEQGREVSGSRISYDAWGRARPVSGPSAYRIPVSGQQLTATSGRSLGYTGHLNLDDLGLIHMGGRVYDPELGRMGSADPNVQYPMSSQGFNRYSYANNNPISYTDPSGYFSLGQLAKAVAIAIVSYYTAGLASGAWSAATTETAAAGSTAAAGGAAAGSAATGSAVAASSTEAALATGGGLAGTSATTVTLGGQIIGGTTGGFVGGALSTGTLQGGLNGAFSGAVFGGINFGYSGQWNLSRVAAHTLAGGSIGKIEGGNFADGALFAGAGALARYGYNEYVGYDVDPKPGVGIVAKRLDPTAGRYPMPTKGVNNVGTLLADKRQAPKFWQEGGPASKTINLVPTVNAIAGPHDVVMRSIMNVFGDGAFSAIANVPLMLPAAIFTWSAFIGTDPARISCEANDSCR